MGRKKKVKDKELSDKHKLFIENYVKNYGNGTRAYMDTYPNAKYNTARVKASMLVTKVNIKKAIDKAFHEVYKDIQTETEKTKTYQLIHAVGNSTIADVVDLEKGTLKVKDLSEISLDGLHSIQAIEMDEKDSEKGYSKNLKVKLHPKLKALEMRAKVQKLIDPDEDKKKLEITIIPAERPVE